MASTILPPAPPHLATYRLPEHARLAIIAQSPAALQRAAIERQRLAFIKKFGNEYGSQHA